MIEIGPIGPNVSDTFSKRLFWIGADVRRRFRFSELVDNSDDKDQQYVAVKVPLILFPCHTLFADHRHEVESGSTRVAREVWFETNMGF